MKRFFRTIWFCVRWGLFIGVVLAAIGGVCVLQQLNVQIKKHVLEEFRQRFPELNVEIGSVELSESKGIAIRKIEISIPSDSEAPGRPLFAADEIFLDCSVTLQTFLKKDGIDIRRFVVKNPIFRLTRMIDGHFAELQYFHLQERAQYPCSTDIRNGTLLYDDLGDRVDEPLKITGLDVTLTPPRPAKSSAAEEQVLSPWKVVGKGKTDFCRQLAVDATIDSETGQWEISGKVSNLDWNADLLGFLPLDRPIRGNAKWQKSLESFQGRVDVGFSAVRDAQAAWGCRFAAEGILDQGRGEDCELGRVISNMSAKFRLTDDEIVVDRLSGLCEAARFVVSYRQEGLTKLRAASLAIDAKALAFDNEFIQAIHPFLNEKTQRLMERFAHSGVGDLDTELSLVNGAWKPKHLNVRFSELNFTFLEFPYSVERLVGDMHIDDAAKINFNLVTRHGEAVRVHVVGNYENLFEAPDGQVQIWGEDVPIDAKLMKTIPSQYRPIVQSLNPSGKITAYLQVILPPGDVPLRKHFSIGLNKVSVRYDKFPYPLREIDGLLRLDDDRWTFENLIGTNESARIELDGHLVPLQATEGEPKSYEFLLKIKADELPVDGQIRESLLDPNHRDILMGIQAKGRVNLGALVRFRSHEHKLSLGFRAIPCPGLQICPKYFPYRIENVQGEIIYNDGEIAIENLRGRNQETTFSAGIRCRFSPDGSWSLRIHPMAIDQLPPHRELQDALQTNLQTIFENLKLRKSVNLRGAVEFSKAGPQAPLRTAWNLGVQLHQNSMNLGLDVKNVFGNVLLTGTSENNDFRLGGELDIASATVYDCQITDIRGPIFYEGASNLVFLGYPAQKILRALPEENPETMPTWQAFRQSTWFHGSPSARPLSGRLFDGAFITEGSVQAGNSMSYSVHCDLIGANLAQFAREFEPGGRNVEGTVNARVAFIGEGRKKETLGGGGTIQLRNANIYELPGMMRLLRELSIREVDPKAGAFSSADVQFRIQGNTIIMDPLAFDGNAFNLQGNGTMRLDNRTVDLLLKARLGNRRSQIPVLSDVLGGAGDQLVQFSVQGSLSEPTFSRIVAPEFQKVIREIQSKESSDVNPPPERKTVPSKLFPWR